MVKANAKESEGCDAKPNLDSNPFSITLRSASLAEQEHSSGSFAEGLTRGFSGEFHERTLAYHIDGIIGSEKLKQIRLTSSKNMGYCETSIFPSTSEGLPHSHVAALRGRIIINGSGRRWYIR